MSEQEKILRHMLSDIAKEKCYENYKIKIKPVDSDGGNYTSKLFLATISAAGKDNINLFAKVAAIGEKMRDIAPKQIFETETYFYTTLLKQYRQLEDEHDVPENERLHTPTFYGSNDEFLNEVMVLEDMAAIGYQVADRFKPMSSEYAFKAVEQLAKLHALSLALAIHHPDDFEITKKVIGNEAGVKTLIEFLGNMSVRVIESIDEDKKEMVTKFIKGVLNRDDLDTLMKPTKVPMIIHGDYRANNLMYKKHNDEIQSMAVLDFQTINFGSPIYDLLYFVINGADKNFLENWYQSTLDRYYVELSAAMKKLHIDPETTYNKADFDYDLNKSLHLSLVLGFCTLLVVTVETDKAPKADMELALKDFAVSPSDLYKERLNGILDFFIEKGLLPGK